MVQRILAVADKIFTELSIYLHLFTLFLPYASSQF